MAAPRSSSPAAAAGSPAASSAVVGGPTSSAPAPDGATPPSSSAAAAAETADSWQLDFDMHPMFLDLPDENPLAADSPPPAAVSVSAGGGVSPVPGLSSLASVGAVAPAAEEQGQMNEFGAPGSALALPFHSQLYENFSPAAHQFGSASSRAPPPSPVVPSGTYHQLFSGAVSWHPAHQTSHRSFRGPGFFAPAQQQNSFLSGLAPSPSGPTPEQDFNEEILGQDHLGAEEEPTRRSRYPSSPFRSPASGFREANPSLTQNSSLPPSAHRAPLLPGWAGRPRFGGNGYGDNWHDGNPLFTGSGRTGGQDLSGQSTNPPRGRHHDARRAAGAARGSSPAPPPSRAARHTYQTAPTGSRLSARRGSNFSGTTLRGPSSSAVGPLAGPLQGGDSSDEEDGAPLITDNVANWARPDNQMHGFDPIPDGVCRLYWERLWKAADRFFYKEGRDQGKNPRAYSAAARQDGRCHRRAVGRLLRSILRSLEDPANLVGRSADVQRRTRDLRQTTEGLTQNSGFIAYLADQENVVLAKSTWLAPGQQLQTQGDHHHPTQDWRWETDMALPN